MAFDEELFFARRLGCGLKPGETIGNDVKAWATGQMSSVPALDFYGEDGTNIRDRFPDYAEPVTDYSEATRLMGASWDLEQKLEKNREKLNLDDQQKRLEYEVYRPRTEFPMWREAVLRSLTAVNGPSPVFERFWAFWVNHFTVNAEPLTKLLYGPHTRTIRGHMMGKFADMLHDAVLQPAMTFYLDNFLSAGPKSEFGRNGDTINENLARELLELHTMSPAGGYTQADVLETAYAISGWGFYSGKSDEEPKKNKKTPFGIRFETRRHEPGTRTILGKTYGKGNKGRDQAAELIADLAVHPATAQFIAFKLIRHFVADEPPEDSVARVKGVWLDTGGDLQAVHNAVIDEVIAKAPGTEKFTTPTQWMHLLHRTLGHQLPRVPPWSGGDTPWINMLCVELGQGYDTAPQPNGFSDLKDDWISKVLLERRVRYAAAVAIKAKKGTLDRVLDYAARLDGPDSALVSAMKAADGQYPALTIFLSSPQFMKV